MTEEDESVLRRRRAAKYPMFLDAPIAKTFMSWATQLGVMLVIGDMSGWKLGVGYHRPGPPRFIQAQQGPVHVYSMISSR